LLNDFCDIKSSDCNAIRHLSWQKVGSQCREDVTEIVKGRRRQMPTNRIAEWRRRRNISQDALAERLGCTRQTMNRLERGHQELRQHWMERIAAALDVRPADLLPDAAGAAAGQDQPAAGAGPAAFPPPSAVILNPPTTPQIRRLILLHRLLDTMQDAAGTSFTAERRAELQAKIDAMLDSHPALWNGDRPLAAASVADAAPAPRASVRVRRQK